MKIKIVIDLEDLLEGMIRDGESEIKQKLKEQIISNIVHEILPKIQKSIDEKITKRVNEIFIDKVDILVNKSLKNVIDNGVMEQSYGNKISISKHIEELFLKNSGWNSPNDHIEVIANRFGKELKAQYNNIFASKIVQKLNEHGFLNDNFIKLLLENTKGQG